MTVPQRAIESMYQRAMNLRDSLPPSGDYPANELREEAYTNTYLRCFANENVTGFKIATRIYRAALRRNVKEELLRPAANRVDHLIGRERMTSLDRRIIAAAEKVERLRKLF